jgi:Domain of unknown function (DUF5642)
MFIRRSAPRVAVGFLVVTTLGLPGCASGGQPHTSSSPSAKAQPAAVPTKPSGEYDISRIAQLANQFPPGYSVTPIPRRTLSQDEADNFGGQFKKFGMTVDPPQCNAALKSVHVVAGSQLQGLSATGPQDIAVIGAQSPQPKPSSPVIEGCDHIVLTAPGKETGTADILPGPAISGVTTNGMKMHLDITLPDGASKTMDLLMYMAALGDKTAVTVTGQSDTQLLEALLVKAVTAVRGQ